jgi:LysM repeat protein
VPETPAPTPAPTPVPTPAPTPVQTYTVAEGDTLAEIAQRFGTSVSALQAANGIEDPDEIVIGQVLVIP